MCVRMCVNSCNDVIVFVLFWLWQWWVCNTYSSCIIVPIWSPELLGVYTCTHVLMWSGSRCPYHPSILEALPYHPSILEALPYHPSILEALPYHPSILEALPYHPSILEATSFIRSSLVLDIADLNSSISSIISGKNSYLQCGVYMISC